MNLLRLIFATFVLFNHSFFVFSADIPNFIPQPINTIIALAVPYFFCISGYLITASAIKNDFKTFLSKRIARIYPAYLACIVLIVCLFAPISYALINGGVFNLAGYITQNPSPIKFFIYAIPLKLFEYHIGTTLSIIHMHTWNASAWTLIFEFGCYMAIFLIIFTLIKFNIKKNKFPKIIFGIYLIFLVFTILFPIDENIKGISDFIRHAFYLLPIFLGGSFVYLIKDKIKFSYFALILSLIYCILMITFLPESVGVVISAIPLTYIILFISVTIKSPKFIKDNDISYGIYIYAWPIQCVIATIIKIYSLPIDIWAYILIVVVITVLFATISWFTIEKPILKKVR